MTKNINIRQKLLQQYENEPNRVPYLNASTYNFNDSNYVKNYFLSVNNQLPFQYEITFDFEVEDFVKALSDLGLQILSRRSKSGIVNNTIEHDALTSIVFTNEDSSIIISSEFEWFNKRRIVTYVCILYLSDREVNHIIDKLCKLKKINRNTKKSIHIITTDGPQLSLMQHNIDFPNIDIDKIYNDDFKTENQLIIDSLNNNKKGIILLHGEPGCGKTSYIRHITSIINNRKIIFFPPNMSNEISSPSFINLLIENKNSILIIEDAENVIKSRKQNSSQAISNLLNVSDGLLSDILNITIIATFNCNLTDIDEALTRKGRMICRYEFKKLNKAKAQKLSDSLGFNRDITDDMTLANIYNQDKGEYTEKKTSIGFKL